MRWAKVRFTGFTFTYSPPPGLTIHPLVTLPGAGQYFYAPYEPDFYSPGVGAYYKKTFTGTLPNTGTPTLGYNVLFADSATPGESYLELRLSARLNTISGQTVEEYTMFRGVPISEYVLDNDPAIGTGTAYVEIVDDQGNQQLAGTDARSPLYTPDLVWGWDGYLWRWITPSESTLHPGLLAAGGGRYHQSVVAVSHGNVYYGSLT
jgi:hypothetical protein